VKSVVVRCPECNAVLEASADSREVRCSYCGTLTVIQRRTGFFQRPEPLPQRPAEAPPAKVATEGRKLGALIGGLLFPLALAVGAPVVICTVAMGTRPYGVAVLADVNGDGTEDVVSLVKSQEKHVLRLAAFEGKSGKKLWRSPELRRGTDLLTLCVAGGVALVGDKGASLMGVNLADGKLRFQVRLEEAVKGLCAGESAATVGVLTADEKLRPLTLADGSVGAPFRPLTCAPLRCDRDGQDQQDGRSLTPPEMGRWKTVLDGMELDRVLERAGVTLVLGYKIPGTQVPMIALVQPPPAPGGAAKVRAGDFTAGHGEAGAPEVRWKTVVPAGDPLAAHAGRPDREMLAVDDKVVAIAYEMSNSDAPHHLTVFSLADGQRRFDVALPEKLRNVWAVRLAGGMVYVTSTWGALVALDAETGKRRFLID